MPHTTPKILVLSSSLFTDRILLYSSFAAAITTQADVEVWVSSLPKNEDIWLQKGYRVKPFPKVEDFRERLNLLREINHTAWAYALPAPAILGMRKFNKAQLKQKEKNHYWQYFPFITFLLGRIIGTLKLHQAYENWLLPKLEKARRSQEAGERLTDLKPDLVVTTGPMWMFDAAVCIEAVQKNIPVFSFIPSWDNITTKSRFTYTSKAFGVWSGVRTQELQQYYPASKKAQIYEVGAPQYDVFFDEKYRESRTVFFERHGLNPQLPVVLWGLGSPLFIKSEFECGLNVLKQMMASGQLEQVQILVRPHPNKDHWEQFEVLKNFHPNVILQHLKQAGFDITKRSQNEAEITDWINTIYHCDLILNMTSTIMLDGTFFDKSAINMAYDDTPDAVFDAYIKAINATWPHVNSVVKSNAAVYAANANDLIAAIFAAIAKPDEKAAERKQLRQMIVNNEDGKSGERLAMAVLKCINLNKP